MTVWTIGGDALNVSALWRSQNRHKPKNARHKVCDRPLLGPKNRPSEGMEGGGAALAVTNFVTL